MGTRSLGGWKRSSAGSWHVEYWRKVSRGPAARPAGTTSWWRSRARAEEYAPRATPGAWPRRRRIWSITSSRGCPCANGSCRFRSDCATSCTATRHSSGGCWRWCCARSRGGCGRAVRGHRQRRASGRSLSSSASARRSMRTCTSTSVSSTGYSARARMGHCAFIQRRARRRCGRRRRRPGAPAGTASLRAQRPARRAGRPDHAPMAPRGRVLRRCERARQRQRPGRPRAAAALLCPTGVRRRAPELAARRRAGALSPAKTPPRWHRAPRPHGERAPRSVGLTRLCKALHSRVYAEFGTMRSSAPVAPAMGF